MARGLLVLGASAVLLLMMAMGSGLTSWEYHRPLGVVAAVVGAGIPMLALANLGWLDRREAAPPKYRARLVPFAGWQVVLLGLTAWLGWSGARNGLIGWFHGLLGGLSTGFALVTMVVAWTSVAARMRTLRERRS